MVLKDLGILADHRLGVEGFFLRVDSSCSSEDGTVEAVHRLGGLDEAVLLLRLYGVDNRVFRQLVVGLVVDPSKLCSAARRL